jgi:hypothetical protein
MGKIFSNHLSKYLTSKIYTEFIQLKSRKPNKPIKKKKMNKGLDQTFLKRGHKSDQQVYEKRFNMTKH